MCTTFALRLVNCVPVRGEYRPRSVLRRLVRSVYQFPANTPALASSRAGAAISVTWAFVGYVTAADFAVNAGTDTRSGAFDNCATDLGPCRNCNFLEVSSLNTSIARLDWTAYRKKKYATSGKLAFPMKPTFLNYIQRMQLESFPWIRPQN